MGLIQKFKNLFFKPDTSDQERIDRWREEVDDIGETMMATSACGLGIAAPNITKSLQKYFPEQVSAHLKNEPISGT